MSKMIKRNGNEVPVYTPPGHDDTYNRRLFGPADGCQYFELIVGEMGRTGHAEPHAHSGFEQSMYMLEGRLRVYGQDGMEVTLESGDAVYFPIGCEHKVICETEKAKFLVIYTPPRQSSKEKVD